MKTMNFEAKTETSLVKIGPSDLESIIKNSGLPLQEADEIKSSYLPFLNQLSETQLQATKINFDNPSDLDENIARELRLRTVKIRTGAEKLKDERKRMYMLRGNLEQASYNLIASSCKMAEEVFFNIEKAREISEKKRKAQLKIDREEKLSPYTDTASLYPLGEMSEEQFNELYSGLRIAHEARIVAEKKAEEDRIENEKKDRIYNSRTSFIAGKKNTWYSQFKTDLVVKFTKDTTEDEWNEILKNIETREVEFAREAEENKKEADRLKKEAKEKEKALEAEREKVRKDNEKKERLAEIERKKQAQIFADQKAKADAEKKALEGKLEAERIQRENIEAEIRRKRDAEEKAKVEAERKKKAEEKKARLAPDKDKLVIFAQSINDLPRPEIKAIEAASIIANANTLLCKVRDYVIENASKL